MFWLDSETEREVTNFSQIRAKQVSHFQFFTKEKPVYLRLKKKYLSFAKEIKTLVYYCNSSRIRSNSEKFLLNCNENPLMDSIAFPIRFELDLLFQHEFLPLLWAEKIFMFFCFSVDSLKIKVLKLFLKKFKKSNKISFFKEVTAFRWRKFIIKNGLKFPELLIFKLGNIVSFLMKTTPSICQINRKNVGKHQILWHSLEKILSEGVGVMVRGHCEYPEFTFHAIAFFLQQNPIILENCQKNILENQNQIIEVEKSQFFCVSIFPSGVLRKIQKIPFFNNILKNKFFLPNAGTSGTEFFVNKNHFLFIEFLDFYSDVETLKKLLNFYLNFSLILYGKRFEFLALANELFNVKKSTKLDLKNNYLIFFSPFFIYDENKSIKNRITVSTKVFRKLLLAKNLDNTQNSNSIPKFPSIFPKFFLELPLDSISMLASEFNQKVQLVDCESTAYLGDFSSEFEKIIFLQLKKENYFFSSEKDFSVPISLIRYHFHNFTGFLRIESNSKCVSTASASPKGETQESHFLKIPKNHKKFNFSQENFNSTNSEFFILDFAKFERFSVGLDFIEKFLGNSDLATQKIIEYFDNSTFFSIFLQKFKNNFFARKFLEFSKKPAKNPPKNLENLQKLFLSYFQHFCSSKIPKNLLLRLEKSGKFFTILENENENFLKENQFFLQVFDEISGEKILFQANQTAFLFPSDPVVAACSFSSPPFSSPSAFCEVEQYKNIFNCIILPRSFSLFHPPAGPSSLLLFQSPQKFNIIWDPDFLPSPPVPPSVSPVVRSLSVSSPLSGKFPSLPSPSLLSPLSSSFAQTIPSAFLPFPSSPLILFLSF